ncbi:hypothetical protein SAMN05444008_1176 [Cnuella takakiae]|uniref:GLPGLI family protein n=1 Tax=Cnuella takakiae TaxID=1302690 RepID=A0A1M5GQ29_9BACT|nr:hypothetical protein [Cnuella takakiae]OLY90936.1 hypothetical protein BUE76_02750 [Cnuella takakiae]SHG05651.1 hypothetical protein SAMN05444008_1176 [Cnuella takakiae]
MRIALLSILLLPTLAQAQGGAGPAASVGISVQRSSHFYTTFDGFPVNQTRYSRVATGSPYLFDHYLPAIVVLGNGTGYEGVRVRLNLVENELQYRDTKGMERVTKVPMKQLVIRDTVSGTEHTLVNSIALPPDAPKSGWYELLADGPLQLLKLRERRLVTEKPFNSASEEQRIEARDRYFVLHKGKYTEVKKPKDLAPFFATQQKEMDAFQKQQRDRELAWERAATEAVQHYNGLESPPAKAAF